jgi:membrane protein DedA with SNARE-associated domain
MSISDFVTVVGTFLAFFTSGCGLGYFIGYRLGRFDQRKEDEHEQKK